MAITKPKAAPAASGHGTAGHDVAQEEPPSGKQLEPQPSGETDTVALGVARRTV
jgi:hypothetical protein